MISHDYIKLRYAGSHILFHGQDSIYLLGEMEGGEELPPVPLT